MQTFKKVFMRTVSFLLCVALGSSVFLFFAGKAKNYYPCEIDKDINYVFNGASQCAMAFIPSLIDEELGVNSFNVSSQKMNFSAKYELLKNIIKTNKVKTVVIEVSNDVLQLEEKKADGGNEIAYRIFKEYMSFGYFFKNVLTPDYIQMEYNKRMNLGYKYIMNVFRGSKDPVIVPSSENRGKGFNKGHEVYETVDITLTEKEIITTNNEIHYELDILDKNLNALSDCIKLCKNNGVNVILVTVPISDAMIWKKDGLDKFYDFMKEYATEKNCEYFDFNLLKTRYRDYFDDKSFYNWGHLSERGAEQFSNDYCRIIKLSEQKNDVSEYFYQTYESMKNESPYMEYYKTHNETK